MRYVPVAAAELHRQFSTSDGVDWARMPALQFNAKDDMQRRFLQSRGIEHLTPTHSIPSSEGFFAAVKIGLGWGMIPEIQLGAELAAGSLVLLEEHDHHDVALYWQSWALDSPRLTRLAESVRKASQQQLRSS